MKKMLCLMLALILSLTAASALASDADTRSVFGYIIDASTNGFEIITDGEQMYSFNRGDATEVLGDEGMLLDSAVLVTYEGDLNLNSEAQSVAVTRITQLNTVYGQIEDATADTIAVRTLNEEGESGQLYLFDRESADVVTGEDGILAGDEVEVAFKESLNDLVADQVQQFEYVHITVYGQIEGEME